MTIATKATIKRLSKIDTEVARILKEKCELAQNTMDWIADGYDVQGTEIYIESGLSIITNSNHEKRYLRGLSTRFERLVQCTFTHGNNQCIITDINELSRKMMAEQ